MHTKELLEARDVHIVVIVVSGKKFVNFLPMPKEMLGFNVIAICRVSRQFSSECTTVVSEFHGSKGEKAGGSEDHVVRCESKRHVVFSCVVNQIGLMSF